MVDCATHEPSLPVSRDFLQCNVWRAQVNAILSRLGEPSTYESLVAISSACNEMICHADGPDDDMEGTHEIECATSFMQRVVVSAGGLIASDEYDDATDDAVEEVEEVIDDANEDATVLCRRASPALVFPNGIDPVTSHDLRSLSGQPAVRRVNAHVATNAATNAAMINSRVLSVDAVVRDVYAASYSVVDALGSGLEPHAFRVFLAHALRLKGFLVAEDVAVSASFMGKVLIDAFRVDLLINETVIVDIAANERPMHEHENRLRYFMEQTAAAAAILLPVCYAGSPADVVVLRGDIE